LQHLHYGVIMATNLSEIISKTLDISKGMTFAMSILFLRQTVVYLLRSNKNSHNAVTFIEGESTRSFRWRFISDGISALLAPWIEKPTESSMSETRMYCDSEIKLRDLMYRLRGADPYDEDVIILTGKAITCGLLTMFFATLSFMFTMLTLIPKEWISIVIG